MRFRKGAPMTAWKAASCSGIAKAPIGLSRVSRPCERALRMTLAYQFKPHERPAIPGSPFNPEHPAMRMWAYGAIGVLAGFTGGLGNALVTTNIAYFQGTLGLTADEAA